MISENIKKYRKANNLSQDDLAEKLNVSRQSISLWENGQTQPTLENIVALAKVFGVSTDALLISSDEQPEEDTAPETPASPDAPSKGSRAREIAIIAVVFVAVAALFVALGLILPSLFASSNKKPKDDSVTVAESEAASASESIIESEPESEPEDIVISFENESSAPEQQESKQESKKQESKQESKKQESKASSTAAKPDMDLLYDTLKKYVMSHGKKTVSGKYTDYSLSKSASYYGRSDSLDFTLWYWGDTYTVEFAIHAIIDADTAINVYLRIPKTYSGKYTYISSYYWRDNGDTICEAKGTITASSMTKSSTLKASSYTGSDSLKSDFMSTSSQLMSELLYCLKSFLQKNDVGYSFTDLGFTKFK